MVKAPDIFNKLEALLTPMDTKELIVSQRSLNVWDEG
jgi:hypothetical protein